MNQRGQLGFYGLVASAVLAVAILALSITPVRFGTVKAVSFGGGLTGRLMEPGLNWKYPWEGTVTYVTLVRTYDASSASRSGDADFRGSDVLARTSDGQQVTISFVVRFKVLPSNVIGVLESVGEMDRVVENVVKASALSVTRTSAQDFTAAQLYSGEGVLAYETQVRDLLQTSFANLGVTLDDFLVQDRVFTSTYVDAIEKKQIASENVVTQRFNADAAKFERDRQISLAEAEGRRNVILAEASAKQIELLADAQAAAIDLQGEALDRHPAMLQWAYIDQLEGSKWIFLPSDGLDMIFPLPETD